MVNAARIHLGNEYCVTCERRVFVATQCSRCQGSMRDHRHAQTEPVCRKCVRADRTCVRCGKSLPSATLLLSNGAVCGPCAYYVVDPRPCELCGTLSHRLLRMRGRSDGPKVCSSCRDANTHATCSHCGRYRAVAGMSIDRRPRCSTCLPGAEASRRCPGCGQVLQGPGRGRCRNCQVGEKVEAHLKLTAAGMQYKWSKTLIAEFSAWYRNRGSQSTIATRHLATYDGFFERLEAAAGAQGTVNQVLLLDQFRPEELLRYKVPLKFLSSHQRVHLDAKVRAEHAAVFHARDALRSGKDEAWHALVSDYAQWLQLTPRKPRTVALYMLAAVGLCKSLSLTSSQGPEQSGLARYLRLHRGQRANLSVFVHFGRQTRDWTCSMPPENDTPGSGEPLLTELELLLSEIQAGKGTEQHFGRALALLLGFEKLDLNAVQWTIGRRSGRPLALRHAGEDVPLPRQVGDLAALWLRTRTASPPTETSKPRARSKAT